MNPRLVLILIAMAPASCEKSAPPVIKPAPPTAVRAVQPERGDIKRWLARPAQVRAQQQAVLYAKITGYLKSIAVDEGDVVRAGDLLAEIEVPQLPAQGAKCRAELEAARIEHERQSDARRRSPDLVTPQVVDAAKTRLELAEAALRAHEAEVGFTRITAPFAGIITKRWVDPGAFIPAATASSSPQSSALLTLMDFNSVRVEVAIPEPEVPFVRTGSAVHLVHDSLSGKGLAGSVTRLAFALDHATRTMNVQVEVANPGLTLRPGMSIEVRIALEEHKGTLLLPAETIVTEKLKTSVFLAAAGRAKKTTVRTGFNDGARVEVLEGVQAGDKVILAGKLGLNDGQEVRIQEPGQ